MPGLAAAPAYYGNTGYGPNSPANYGYGYNAPAYKTLPVALRVHVFRPNLDKLARGVLDALGEAGVWRDDAQVVELGVRKEYGERAGAMVMVRAAA